MDPLWLIAAFLFGALLSKIGMPPLVGYLIAGFVLNLFGVKGGEILTDIADAGVTLLLFTIGLKLKLKNLARPEIWGGAAIQMVMTALLFWLVIFLFSSMSLPYFRMLDTKSTLLLAFALSFSSTVFAVKVFESKKEMSSRHAATAIGILIIQDLFAVIFLAFSTGKLPSVWAPALLLLLLAGKPLLYRLISHCGHGELLMLFGILMTFGGYASFELVDLKGDLGALIFGMLLASSPKADELADRLLSFKDLFLVGFFLNIGISGIPTLSGIAVAFLIVLTVPVKLALIFTILTRFKLRIRTAMLTSFSLTNFSEFGLIVGFIGVTGNWLDREWLTIIAVALSLSFFLASPLNSSAHAVYARISNRLKLFETEERLPEDSLISSGEARIGIIGMGGIGTAAYDAIEGKYGDIAMGMDFNDDLVKIHRKQGRNVIKGDAEDYDFWKRYDPGSSRFILIMLTLPTPEASTFAIQQLRQQGYTGQIAASVRHQDQIGILKQAGIDEAYSLHQEAGAGFANHSMNSIDQSLLSNLDEA